MLRNCGDLGALAWARLLVHHELAEWIRYFVFKGDMQYIEFWTGWFGFWGTIISLMIAFYSIAIVDRSKDYARALVHSSAPERLFSRAFWAASNLSATIFGPRLLSFRAFLSGVSISLLCFLIFYSLAIFTTDELQLITHNAIEFFRHGSPIGPAGPTNITRWPFIYNILLIVVSLTFEFFYVLKSRWLIRFIGFDMVWYGALFILAVDILSTFVIFSFLAPIPLLGFAELMVHSPEVLDLLDSHKFFVASSSVRTVDHIPQNSSFGVYLMLVNIMLREIVSHFAEGFKYYHFVAAGEMYRAPIQLPLDTWARFFPNFEPDVLQAARNRGQSFVYAQADLHLALPATTLLASAFSTTIWTIICATTLLVSRLLYRVIAVSRRFFLVIHERPLNIVYYGVIPCSAIALLGGALITLILLL